MQRRVLIIDDDRPLCELLAAELATHDIEVTWATSAEEGLERLESESFPIVLTDIEMRGMSGVELCQHIASTREGVLVIVMTSYGSLESAISAIRSGAYDYVPKPFESRSLFLALERAFKHVELRDEVHRLRLAVERTSRFDTMLGASAGMQKVFSLISRVAGTDATVLVTGESGTGKELVARALHERGPRKQGSFVALSCAAVPETLLESELFGHSRGAFTDARTAREGLILQANGGTLFLDEIGEMPLGMQAKLLRTLAERKVRPVGSNAEISFDARIVAATHADLNLAVAEKRFREDLFYRINVVHIHVPPLRSRGSDVLLLAQTFLERFAAHSRRGVTSLSGPAAEKILAYNWPGNVRQLQNCIERAVALAPFATIALGDLPENVRNYVPEGSSPAGFEESFAAMLTMDELERRYIQHVMTVLGGNKTQAAQTLGLDRRTLYRKLERMRELGGKPPSD